MEMDDTLKLCSSSSYEYKGQLVGISPIDEVEHWVSRSEEREHMFDKVVTPSDVGKLNRLVIPKQYAEKYLPSLLDKDSSSNSNNNHKGLLLNFEDRNGKPWRFRYSYWNSSQSYVMTKGWSRFVKDKKLDAGDIISFHRNSNKLFIDWRRRPRHRRPDPLPLITTLFPRTCTPFLFRSPPPPPLSVMDTHSHTTGTCQHSPCGCVGVANPYSSASSLVFLTSSPSTAHPLISLVSSSSSSVELHGDQGGGAAPAPMLFQGKAAAKRLRLFGVNIDCPISHQSPPPADDCDILSSVSPSTSSSSPSHFHHHHHHHQQQNCAAAFGMSTHIGPPYPSSSSSANHHHLPLQLSRLHNTTFLPAHFHDKGKSSSSSSMSLHFDI